MANTVDIFIKSQPHSAYGFLGFFFFFFFFFAFWFLSQPIKKSSRPKIIWQIEHCLRNISMKVLSKYLERLGSKCRFSIFPKSMETLSCHSKQTKRAEFHKEYKTWKVQYGEYFHCLSLIEHMFFYLILFIYLFV